MGGSPVTRLGQVWGKAAGKLPCRTGYFPEGWALASGQASVVRVGGLRRVAGVPGCVQGVWLGLKGFPPFFFFFLFYPGPDSSLFACSPIGSSLGMSTFISLQALRITYD